MQKSGQGWDRVIPGVAETSPVHRLTLVSMGLTALKKRKWRISRRHFAS